MKILGFFALLGAVAASVLPAVSQAQSAYPDKPIRFIVSFPPGSGADSSARYYAKHMEDRLGQSVVVENRPGGNSFIAAQAVTGAAPDGYTLLFASNSPVATNVATFKSLPYDPLKQLTPVARLSKGVMAVAVSAGSPYQSVDDLVSALKARPGELNYGGGSSSYQIATELFLHKAGAKATHIPYKGAAPALVDLAGNQVDLVFADFGAVVPHLQSEKVRILAITGNERLPNFPDIPTLQESGFPDYFMINWTGLFAPAGTPGDIVDKLSKHMLEIAALPETHEYSQRMSSQGFSAGKDEFARFQQEEITRWDDARETAGIPKQ